MDPRHGAGGPSVHPDRFPARGWRVGDGGDQRTRPVDVDAEHGLPGELRRNVPPGWGVADPAPFPRFGERDLGGRFEPGRVEREGAVGQAAAAGAVMDAAVRGAAVGVIDAPAGRGGGNQLHSRRGRTPTQHRPGLADAGAAAGGLLAVDGGEGRGRELDGVRSDGELLGDKQGQRRGHALAHLGLGEAQHDAAVGADFHPGVGVAGVAHGAVSRGGIP
ncbi:hypothetical protein KBTX_04208 [wastewater metagenome]|uniref:Uncharacterized protein n=2 Tax=unclassified sequences TaxID=12908 RepID=A0A5B8RIH1_9ZZZZ|nr:hypothetical protein KBTEX_04208 [uncultured organism]